MQRNGKGRIGSVVFLLLCAVGVYGAVRALVEGARVVYLTCSRASSECTTVEYSLTGRDERRFSAKGLASARARRIQDEPQTYVIELETDAGWIALSPNDLPVDPVDVEQELNTRIRDTRSGELEWRLGPAWPWLILFVIIGPLSGVGVWVCLKGLLHRREPATGA
jgi:hypothetical protein